MTIEVIVNNYMLGAKVKSTPVHKITKQERIDSKHTLLIYSDVSTKEISFIEKVLSCKTNILD